MTKNNRYPTSYTFFSGLAGAIAWGFPYLIFPFLVFIPLISRIPDYESPPYHISLTRFMISFSFAGIIAIGLFLLVLRFLPIDRERFSRLPLSSPIVLSSFVGMAIGSAFAALFGSVVAYSQTGYSLANNLGFFSNLPEPCLSIGWVIGTALTTIIICAFSGIVKPIASNQDSLIKITLGITLNVSGRAFIVRFLTYIIEYSSFVRYTFGESIMVFILFQIVSGAFFGILTWIYCSRLHVA